jgi:hypothetical protein
MDKLRKLSKELPKLKSFKKRSKERRSDNNLAISVPSDFKHIFCGIKFDENFEKLVEMLDDLKLILKKNDIK